MRVFASGWLRAGLAALALAAPGLFIFAVLPSWWLYLAAARLQWTGGIRAAMADAVATGIQGMGFVAAVVAALAWQRRHPVELAPGEERPRGGGYR